MQKTCQVRKAKNSFGMNTDISKENVNVGDFTVATRSMIQRQLL